MNALPDLPRTALEERDILVERLMELIQTTTDEELLYIAEADPGATPFQIRKQEAALRTILFKRRGRMTEKHVHFPGEVLSIVAEDPNEHIDRAFEIATSVLMITALLHDDRDGAMSLLWGANGPVYAHCAPAFLGTILCGFRWLASHATEWGFPHEPGTVPAIPSLGEIAALVEGAVSAPNAPAG